jgi:hypothetical protein
MQGKSMVGAKRRLAVLKKQIGRIGPVMRGSVVTLGSKCGNPRCRCARGKKHQQYYFSVTKEGKTKLIFLGKTRLNIATEYANNYRKLLDIADEISDINREIIKNLKP